MSNESYDSNDRDPAGIKHVSYGAGISLGVSVFSGYTEASIETNDKGKFEPSLNVGMNKEISIGSEGVEKSTNYYNSIGGAVGIKNVLSVYAEKTTYVNKDDVDKYNERVKDYEKLKEHPIYKSNRAIREDILHDYNDCIHPHDYNKEFNIPK